MRQNYHLYIHKVLAQLSLRVEAQPSQAQLILNTNFPNLRCWRFLFVERANEQRSREENEAEATISLP